ncbi:MAG: class I SAM-dependent methyltransferase, partial [Planctomycetes bacterium]|nr:class I SAM-dependent methyltransferase [Planctomycetota bacterium]
MVDILVETADKYRLYTAAFQRPDAELRAITDLFQLNSHRQPCGMREDFCGTAANCLSWVRAAQDRVAYGVDIDPEPLAWCRQHYLDQLTPDETRRLQLVSGNVLDVVTPKVDLILALNSSFCVFKSRELLRRYLMRCHDSLLDSGILVLEVYAGPESQMSGQDRIQGDGFTAIWEQVKFNAVTNEALNRIHFEMADGSRLECAFEYDYRLWAPAELREALLETGFHNARVFRKDIKDHIGKTDFSWALTPPDKPPLSYLLFRGTGWRTLLKLIIPVVLLVIIFVKEPISIAVFIAILITLAIFLCF